MKWILVAAMIVTSMVAIQPVEAGLKSLRKTANVEKGSTFTDTVKKIRDDDEGVVILFEKTTGAHYLRRELADFDALRKKLETSLSSKKPVSVTFDPEQLNILEVK